MAEPIYSLEQISRQLAGYGGYGGGYFGPSFRDDYRNARAKLNGLNDLYGDQRDQNYDLISAGLKGRMGSAIAGGAIAGLTGATQLAGNAMQAAQINDTTKYENELQDYVDYSNYNYSNYDSLSNAMSQNYLSPMPDYDEIRGMTKGEKIGNLASSALQGASMGMQIGGPVGAAIGGAAGLLTSGIGIISGNNAARRQEDLINAKAINAQYAANQNFQAAHERIGDYNNRKGAVNSVAKGGQIETSKRESITEFANRKLRKPYQAARHSSSITREYCDGGVRIRFRR